MEKRIIILILCLSFLMMAVAPIGATAAAPTVTLPSLTEDSNCASYETSDNSKIYYYTGVSKSNFDSYVSTLKNEGYTEAKTYTADSCYYSLLDNGANTVFVSFLRSVSGSTRGRLRVFVQASGTSYHTQSEATTASVCEPMLWQLDVDNSVGENGGMSYVIRLTDGTFVIIDGGYRTEKEAKNLYSVLASNNPLDGNPEVSAWFITHAHLDHYGILSQFTSMYSDSVTVKGFYYNFPSENVGDIWSSNCKGIETEMKKWSGAKLYSKIHSGMVMGFAGATVEVLATHEDVKQSYYSGVLSSLNENGFDGNGSNTSTVLRFNIAGQKIMFLADAENGVSYALTGTYTSSFLKSDIMQMAHHGFEDGVKPGLIEAIDPDVILWPMDIIKYENGAISEHYTHTFGEKYELTDDSDITEAKKASEIIPAYKNEALSLPYTKNTLYSGKTPDYQTLRTAKTKLLNSAKGIYVQESLDHSKIRFVGVLNLTEQELEEYKNVGFDISMIYNGTTYQNSLTTTTVYTSLIANGKPIYASAYGGTYFYAIEITDINLARSGIEFIIEGTGTYKNGNTEYMLSYDVERYIVTPAFGAADSGEMPSVDFSDIISGAWKEIIAQ